MAIFSNNCSSVSPRITAILSLPVSTDSHITAVAALAALTSEGDPIDIARHPASVSAAARCSVDFAVLRADVRKNATVNVLDVARDLDHSGLNCATQLSASGNLASGY